jgi:parvulin-like peptidyl-prolyl isomerase
VRRWLGEPLLQFLVIGLALFAIDGVVSGQRGDRSTSSRIELTDDDLRQMTVAWLAQGRPAPTPPQLRSLVESRVREEILYREALALGLEKNDTIVKRRMAQKMEFLAEDVGALRDPSADELRAWFEKNAARFARPPRVSLRHLYFSPDRRGPRARDEAARALQRLAGKAGDWPGAASLADPFMYQDYYGDRSLEQLATVFGPAFADAVVQLEPGAWHGPVESGYGWHLVWLDSLEPSRIPPFEEVEADVRSQWVADQRAESKQRAFEAMRARYEVVLTGSALAALSGSAGTAR